MKFSRLILRNLYHYWPVNLAVMAGVATAVAVLAGALMVGESVRESLRSLAYQRIGATDYVVAAEHFFREDLAGELSLAAGAADPIQSCPIIQLQGILFHEATGARALNVNVFGIDERFWKFHGLAGRAALPDRAALVGSALAEKLGARPEDALLLRIESQQGIPRESLFGRRDDVGRTTRLVCNGILPAEDLGEFALSPGQGNVYSVFVPLKRLQRDLAQPSAANAILLASGSGGGKPERIRDALGKAVTLKDMGVELRPLPSSAGISVESPRIILGGSIAREVGGAAADAGMRTSGVFTYMANAIRAGGREIPYSVITAVDLHRGAMTAVREIEGLTTASAPADDAIWLNDWAWRDLRVAQGEAVEVDYYVWQEEGRLVTTTARFRLAGVFSIGGDIDTALAPSYPGITDAESMTAWDPPFPLDLRRIRKQDEEYWQRYRAAPKAIVRLSMGQSLWRSRFGSLSAIRVAAPEGADLNSVQERFARGLRDRLDPELSGFSVIAVRDRGADASRGSTNFGEYFVYFSFFLIAAAILLSALFFRLGVEQRVREIGTLQAVGFPHSMVNRIFLLEGLLLSASGTVLGLLGSIGYGWLLVFGLRTWWLDAVGSQRLYLHVSRADLALGAGIGMLVSIATIAVTLRGLHRNSPRTLLSGVLETAWVRSRRARGFGIAAPVAFLAACLVLLGSAFGKVSSAGGFFGAGLLLLVATLSLAAVYLRRARPGTIDGHGWPALFRLGARNAAHRPGRSVLCIALIAAATFVIVSVEAFRKDARSLSLEAISGTGGYALLAQSSLPIIHDPNSAEGREALGIPDSELPTLAQARFVPFRLRPGDDVSCLNLYAPQEPRILGAPHSFLASARFAFEDSLATTAAEKRNPWLLLEAEAKDGIIPAIGDANTIRHILHLEVGRELVLRRNGGAPVRLRLVAALRDSLFQGELLISETNFLRLFPEQEGFRFFLLDAPPDHSASLARALEERLGDWGFIVESSLERLAAYHRVENTYLSTFQSLGTLGLVLGTVGLATVLLRNVLERKKELALLRAVGYRRQVLSGIIVAENLVLLVSGIVCGTACALVAILPALHARGAPFPAAMVSLMLVAVLLIGLTSSILAVLAAFRSPLLDALRSE